MPQIQESCSWHPSCWSESTRLLARTHLLSNLSPAGSAQVRMRCTYVRVNVEDFLHCMRKGKLVELIGIRASSCQQSPIHVCKGEPLFSSAALCLTAELCSVSLGHCMHNRHTVHIYAMSPLMIKICIIDVPIRISPKVMMVIELPGRLYARPAVPYQS